MALVSKGIPDGYTEEQLFIQTIGDNQYYVNHDGVRVDELNINKLDNNQLLNMNNDLSAQLQQANDALAELTKNKKV